MSHNIREVGEDAFKGAIKQGVVLVDFYADWCGPCKMIAPQLEIVAKELEGKASIIKVDIEQAQRVASECQVTSIPTLIVFKSGQEVGRIVGMKNAKDIQAFVMASITAD